jgi:hypothetical protein
MAKGTFGYQVGESTGETATPVEGNTLTEERAITSQMVTDGVYKYVYVDTGEDYTP